MLWLRGNPRVHLTWLIFYLDFTLCKSGRMFAKCKSNFNNLYTPLTTTGVLKSSTCFPTNPQETVSSLIAWLDNWKTCTSWTHANVCTHKYAICYSSQLCVNAYKTPHNSPLQIFPQFFFFLYLGKDIPPSSIIFLLVARDRNRKALLSPAFQSPLEV